MFDFIEDTWDWVCENPVKTCAILAGGATIVFSGPIAGLIGAKGLLAETASGTVISTLKGAALRSASLKALGTTIGVPSMTGGTVVVGAGGTTAGSAIGGVISKVKA